MTDIQSLIQEYKMTGSKDIYAKILEQIRVMDTLWVPVSQHTRSTYIEIRDNMPTAFIFTKQSYCEEFREKLSSNMLLVRTVSNVPKLRLPMFSDFVRSGIKKIIIDQGHVYQEIMITDMVKEAEPPAGQRKPVKNPELVVCANIFVQEMSRRNAAPAFRDKLIKAVREGEFLVPANKNVQVDETGKILDGSPITFNVIRNNLGQNFIPVYTDLLEFRKYDPEGKFASIVMPFEGIKPLLNQAEGIIINPQGVNLPLNLKLNDKNNQPVKAVEKPASINNQIKEALNPEKDDDLEEDNFVLGSDEPLSEDMLKEVSDFLSTQPQVSRAYAVAITRNKRPACLYIVEYEGESIEIYQGIVMASAMHIGALQVEMRDYSIQKYKRLTAGMTPFYSCR